MNSFKSRVAEVNRELKKRGIAATLRSGGNYYYFVGTDDKFFRSNWSVYVFRASQLSVEQWLAEYEQLEKESAR
jgi:hypothetical protein